MTKSVTSQLEKFSRISFKMGKKCSVTNCKSGYDSNKTKVSIFKSPKNPELLEKWRKALKREDLKKNHNICEYHFNPEDIIREWRSLDMIVKYQYPRLKIDAVPNCFPNGPCCFPDALPEEQNPIINYDEDTPVMHIRKDNNDLTDVSTLEDPLRLNIEYEESEIVKNEESEPFVVNKSIAEILADCPIIEQETNCNNV